MRRFAVDFGGSMMSTSFGAGFHVAPGRAVDASAYDRFTGRWSRLFVPAVLSAAEVGQDAECSIWLPEPEKPR